MKKTHSKLAPSAAHRWIPCPGSIALSADVPYSRNPAATQGTGAHALAEHLLKKKEKPAKYLGKKFKFSDGGQEASLTVDEEMLESVQVLLDTVRAHVEILDDPEVHLEKNVRLDHVRPGMGGTADVIIHESLGRLIVIDYKHGFTPVHLVKNKTAFAMSGQKGEAGWKMFLEANIAPQLLIYAAGAAREIGWECLEIVVQIVQPRCQEVENVQTAIIETRHLKRWHDDFLFEKACAAEMSGAPLVAGDHCRFCPALSKCPEVYKEMQHLAKVEFADVLDESSDARVVAKMTEALLPAAMSEEQLAVHLSQILAWAPILDAWIRQASEAVFQLLQRGVSVPGFKVVRKRSNRGWLKLGADDNWTGMSEKEIIAALRKHVKKFKPADLYNEPTLMSPTQLEKNPLFKKAVAAIAQKPAGELTLASITDRRDAVEPARDFAGTEK